MTPIVPAKRPEISRETATAWAREAGFAGETFVVGRRGYFRTTLQTTGEGRGSYDDAIAFVAPDFLLTVNANTDPSASAVGTAVLQPGIWPFAPAIHHPGTTKAYPCFMQAGPVVVRRDGTDAVAKGTRHEKYGECLGDSLWRGSDFCIQLHHGYRFETASLGCQTIYLPQWQQAFDQWTDVLAKRGLASFPYILTVRPE